MQFFEQSRNNFASLYQNRKKTVIIVSILCVLTIGSLLAGIFFPTTPPKDTSKSTSANAEPTKPPYDGREPETVVYYTQTPPTPTPSPVLTKEERIVLYGTPTPTPLPGIFYTPNGKQNDLQIRYLHNNDGDSFDEVRILNSKTTEERIIGFMYHYTPGDNAIFSKDFSQIIYIGGQSKEDYNKITFYSIGLKRNVKEITFAQMQKKLPALKNDPLSAMGMLKISPDENKIAFSYGNTYNVNQIAPDTQIVVINLTNNNMALLSVNGLVHGWKDDATLQYDAPTANPNVNATQEVPVPSL
jgi:hypothetical protein